MRAYEQFSDIEETDQVTLYKLEEIAVEKTVALLDKARTEPRDLYDMWILTEDHGIDLELLVPEIEKKLEFRKKKVDNERGNFEKKQPRYKALWKTRLENQMATLEQFDNVWRDVHREFRKANLAVIDVTRFD